MDGVILPTLVYMAREKNPEHFHNFKAGAMNALVSLVSFAHHIREILDANVDDFFD